MHHLGPHHQSLRRQGIISSSSFRSKFALHAIDTLAYVVSILSLLFTIDQVRIIWLDKDASGVSLLSWIFYTLSALVWLVYGYVHRDRVLIITNILWVALSLFIVIGIMLHA